MTNELDVRPGDGAEPSTEAWAEGLLAYHASHSELAALLGPSEQVRTGRTHSHLRLCATCREGLAARIEEAVFDEHDTDECARRLSQFILHEDPVVRASATRAALTLKAEVSSVDELVKALLLDQDALVRADALAVLSDLEGPTRAVIDRLCAALWDTATGVRIAAASTLKALGEEAVILACQALSLPVESEWSALQPALVLNEGKVSKPLRVVRNDSAFLMLSVKTDSSGKHTIRISYRNPALIGLAVELAAGEWKGSAPLTRVVREPWQDSDVEEWVSAVAEISAEERRSKIPLDAKLTGRVVRWTGSA